MCGIGFFINYSNKPIETRCIKFLWEELSNRGTDASGIYYERIEENNLVKRIIKAPIESKKLFPLLQDKKTEWKQFAINGKERVILLHTRAKTTGTEYINKNNGPISSKNYILIHNGVITNSRLSDYKYKGEVDSEEILAYIETYGMTEGLSKLTGSISCVIKPINEDFIYLYRNTNPLTLSYLIKEKLLIGSSNEDFIDIPKEYHMLTHSLFKPQCNLMRPYELNLYKISTTSPNVEIVDMAKPKKQDKIIKTHNVEVCE